MADTGTSNDTIGEFSKQKMTKNLERKKKTSNKDIMTKVT